MAGSMLDAFKKAGLADRRVLQQIDEQRRRNLERAERDSAAAAEFAVTRDVVASKKEEKFLKVAARETTKPASRVGTRAYYDRFKK